MSRRVLGGSVQDVRVVPHRAPIAYTRGLFRRQIIVSTGMVEGLDPDERDAVIAHERAHVRGRHTGLMFIGRVLLRAFGFLPPVERAVQQLLLGLEAAADDRAASVVGSRIVVARALAKLAELTAFDPITPSLGAVTSDVVQRVRRLANQEPSVGSRMGISGQIAVTLAIALVLAQGAALSLITASGLSSAQQLHTVCHLPHPGQAF